MDGVVVTGRGAVSPLGVGVERLTKGLLTNQIAFCDPPWPRIDGFGKWWSVVRDFRPLDWMSPQVEAGTDLFAQFAVAAAAQAVDESGIDVLPPQRTAIVVGTSLGGMRALLKAQHALDTVGPHGIDRKTMLKFFPNMAAAQLAMRWDLHGPTVTVCTACAASLDAIGMAVDQITSGRVDVAVVGGSEGGFTAADGSAEGEFVPANFHCQPLLGMESGEYDPARASLPFDRNRSGIVTGDGAAFLVLESAEHAHRRGASTLGEVLGHASLADGHHPSAPEPSGRWEAAVMQAALADAGVPADRVDAVFAHATGTPKGDTAEIRAIKTVHRDRRALPVTSLKGHIGHTGASAGAMSVLSALDCLGSRVIPNIGCTTELDTEVDFDVVLHEPRTITAEIVQVNAFGFGGQNSSLVLRRAR